MYIGLYLFVTGIFIWMYWSSSGKSGRGDIGIPSPLIIWILCLPGTYFLRFNHNLATVRDVDLSGCGSAHLAALQVVDDSGIVLALHFLDAGCIII